MAQVHARRIPALPQGYKVLHGCNLRPRPQTPRTHTAFTDLAHAETTGPHTVIDGSGTIEQVHERVLAAITPLLAQRSLPRENTAPTKEAL